MKFVVKCIVYPAAGQNFFPLTSSDEGGGKYILHNISYGWKFGRAIADRIWPKLQ